MEQAAKKTILENGIRDFTQSKRMLHIAAVGYLDAFERLKANREAVTGCGGMRLDPETESCVRKIIEISE